jgi:hypothetical protein
MGKILTPFMQRKEAQLQREQRIIAVLQNSRERQEEAKQLRKHKRKTADVLLGYLSITNTQLSARCLRDASTYTPRSYNMDKQLVGLIDHLYVKFPVPEFAYQVFRNNKNDQFNCLRDIYQRWFVALSQGESFSKLVKGVMTSKEASQFLKAPADGLIHENVWFAKLVVAGLPDAISQKLVSKLFTNFCFDDPDHRIAEVVSFYANHWTTMGKREMEEITDFLAWKLADDAAFRLKGRTTASVTKLSNEWHIQIQKARYGRYLKWKGLGILPWQHVIKSSVFEAHELLDNRELLNEGRKQAHCVYSYVSWCETGRLTIFSLREYTKKYSGSFTEFGEPVYDRSEELSRITIEVNQASRSIVQIRGRQNRRADDRQMKIIELWAAVTGLTIARPSR